MHPLFLLSQKWCSKKGWTVSVGGKLKSVGFFLANASAAKRERGEKHGERRERRMAACDTARPINLSRPVRRTRTAGCVLCSRDIRKPATPRNALLLLILQRVKVAHTQNMYVGRGTINHPVTACLVCGLVVVARQSGERQWGSATTMAHYVECPFVTAVADGQTPLLGAKGVVVNPPHRNWWQWHHTTLTSLSSPRPLFGV